MKVARSAPFFTAPDDSVEGVAWRLVLDGEEQVVTDSVRSWDPAMDLRFLRTVVVKPKVIREACRLPKSACFRLVSIWRTGTALRNRTQRTLVQGEQPVTLMMELRARGSDLSGTISLNTVLALDVAVPPAPLRPFRAGSILWEDSHKLLLEGGGSRFPMEVIQFSRSRGFPPRAGWLLDWQPSELDAPVLAGMRLYLNAEHAAVCQAVREPKDPRSMVIMASIQFDVARQLIRGALQNELFVARDEPYPKETVGRAIHRLLKARFKGMTPMHLRNAMLDDPDQFDALLQDKMGLFEGLV